MVSSKLSFVEEGVLNSLKKHLTELQIKMNQLPNETSDLYTIPLQTAEQELKNIETQLNRLHDLLEQGVYTIDTFLSRQKTLLRKTDGNPGYHLYHPVQTRGKPATRLQNYVSKGSARTRNLSQLQLSATQFVVKIRH